MQHTTVAFTIEQVIENYRSTKLDADTIAAQVDAASFIDATSRADYYDQYLLRELRRKNTGESIAEKSDETHAEESVIHGRHDYDLLIKAIGRYATKARQGAREQELLNKAANVKRNDNGLTVSEAIDLLTRVKGMDKASERKAAIKVALDKGYTVYNIKEILTSLLGRINDDKIDTALWKLSRLVR